MRVEVVAYQTCPRCHGTKKETLPAETIFGQQYPKQSVVCCECEATGEISRVLAPLPEWAELRRLIMDEFRLAHSGPVDALNDSTDAVLAIFGMGEAT